MNQDLSQWGYEDLWEKLTKQTGETNYEVEKAGNQEQLCERYFKEEEVCDYIKYHWKLTLASSHRESIGDLDKSIF